MAIAERDSGGTQRAPGYVSGSIPPGNPGGRPDGPGDPVPADPNRPVPPAIVVRRPSPRIVGDERPTPVGQHPAAVVVGAPAPAHGWYPDAAIRRHERPVPVWRQPLVEDGLARHLGAGGRRRLRLALIALVVRVRRRRIGVGGRRRWSFDAPVVADRLALVDAAGGRGGEGDGRQNGETTHDGSPCVLGQAFSPADSRNARSVRQPHAGGSCKAGGEATARRAARYCFNDDIHARWGTASLPQTPAP